MSNLLNQIADLIGKRSNQNYRTPPFNPETVEQSVNLPTIGQMPNDGRDVPDWRTAPPLPTIGAPVAAAPVISTMPAPVDVNSEMAMKSRQINLPTVGTGINPANVPAPPDLPPISTEEKFINAANNIPAPVELPRLTQLQNERDGLASEKNQHWSTLEKVLSGIAGFASGGIGGAISAGTDRNFFTNIKNAPKIGRLDGRIAQEQKSIDFNNDQAYRQAQTATVTDKPILAREQMRAKVEAENRRSQARTDAINRQADIRSGEAKIYIDEDGKKWKQYLKADSTGKTREMEPIINPQTGEQDYEPGEQSVDWIDDYGNPIRVKAKQTLMPSATRDAGNAQRRQDADKTNSSQQFEAQKANATNLINYNKQTLDKAMEIAKGEGADLANVGELQGIAGENVAFVEQLQNIDLNNELDTPEEKAKKQTEYNRIATKIAENDGKYSAALGKTNAGRKALEAMRAQGIIRPPTVRAVNIQAAQVTSGVRSRLDDSTLISQIKKAFPNESDSQISARVAQAKKDGWGK